MKIEEAANLSLLASALNAGDVHILDMGEPVKLLDVINKLIEILNGKSEIVVVGLRDGEKIQEELWSSKEILFQTEIAAIKALNLVIPKQIPNDCLGNPSNDSESVAEIVRFLSGSDIGL
jgi:FlaA1/EpsC-like NDP-sugar epimerase